MKVLVWIFLVDVAVILAAALVVVRYLMPYLKQILVDVCGNELRSNFWTAFSNVTLVLTPAIFAMHVRPESGETLLIFQAASQIEWGLIGLVVAVLTLGIVIGSFIPRQPVKS